MEYEQKRNEGKAFQEKEKKEDWHDDWKGDVDVDGTMYWIGWTDRVAASGTEWKKIKVRPKDTGYVPRDKPSYKDDGPKAEGSDIPF